MNLETKSAGRIDVKYVAQGDVIARVAELGIVDRDGDVILPTALPPTSPVKLSLYGHDVILENAPPVGKGVVRVEGRQVKLYGRYFLKTTRGRDGFETVKALGPDGEWSIGYRVPQTVLVSPEWRRLGAKRVISGLELVEVSPVFVGSGLNTGTISAKAARDAVARDITTRHENQEDTERRLAESMALFHRQFGPTVETRVHPERHTLATKIAGWAAAKWRLSPPVVRWFTKEWTTAPAYFMASDPAAIWLRSDIGSGAELLRLTCHETSHFARHKLRLPNNETEVAADTMALVAAYGSEWADAYRPPLPRHAWNF